jgi:hypothetical protein
MMQFMGASKTSRWVLQRALMDINGVIEMQIFTSGRLVFGESKYSAVWIQHIRL